MAFVVTVLIPFFKLALAELYCALSPDLNAMLRSLIRSRTSLVIQGFCVCVYQKCLCVDDHLNFTLYLCVCSLCGCEVTDEGFGDLASALRSNPSSHLRELNLRQNDPGVSGVKQISDLLKDPHCTLETLNLCNCQVTDEGFCDLASALRSNPSSHLRELNLSDNDPGVSGVKQISDLLKDPHCTLETLDLCGCEVTDEGFCDLASALRSNPSSHLRELHLSDNNPGVSGVKQISDLLKDPKCTLKTLDLSHCKVTDEGFCDLASALRSNPSSHLRELNLSGNNPGVSGVKQISDLLKDPHCTLETLDLCACKVTDEGFCDLASALRSNPSSHLRELNLSHNNPGVSGVKQISDLLKDPQCTLKTLETPAACFRHRYEYFTNDK
nr:ribonuclease inhibitor-like [Misgurnus anguillicaudatus]